MNGIKKQMKLKSWTYLLNRQNESSDRRGSLIWSFLIVLTWMLGLRLIWGSLSWHLGLWTPCWHSLTFWTVMYSVHAHHVLFVFIFYFFSSNHKRQQDRNCYHISYVIKQTKNIFTTYLTDCDNVILSDHLTGTASVLHVHLFTWGRLMHVSKHTEKLIILVI